MANTYQNFSNPTITSDQPMGWQYASQGMSSLVSKASDYIMQQHKAVQDLQLSQAQDLSKFKTLDQIYYGGAHSDQIDSILQNNPYGRQLITQKPSGMAQSASGTYPGNPAVGATMIGMPGMSNVTGGSMLPAPPNSMGITPLTNGTPSPTGSTGSMSAVNPLGSPVVTSGSMTQKAFEPPSYSQSFANPLGEAAVQSAKSQAQANVEVPKEYATKMVNAQALSNENLARDNTQMMSVFQTLKNLHDIHSQLGKSKLAGTHLGDVGQRALPFIGDIAAFTGQDPEKLQNAVMTPENQNLIGQFQAGRNEGITRAIQPLQNQVDKTGSSRISESLLGMTEGEYGNLEDTNSQFDGKTLGTAKTLYRITLASQNYADDLKKQGIQLNGSDKNFNPDAVAKTIYDNAKAIELSPAQNAEMNKYANTILGTKDMDYSGTTPKPMVQGNGGSQNPVMNQQNQTQGKPISMQIAQQILAQAGGDKDKARLIASQQGYSF